MGKINVVRFPQDGEIIQHSPFRRQIAKLKNQSAKKRDYGADEIAAVMGKRAPRRCAPTNTARRICHAGAEGVFRRNAISRESPVHQRQVGGLEPTVARGNRRLSVVRAVHEPTRSESEGEHVCGPDVISTATVKGAREISAGRSPLAKQVARAVRARRNHVISPEGAQRLSAEGGSMRGVGCPQTAGRYPPNEVSRVAGAMRGASMSGQCPDIARLWLPDRSRCRRQAGKNWG